MYKEIDNYFYFNFFFPLLTLYHRKCQGFSSLFTARIKTYKNYRTVNGVPSTPSFWFQPFIDVAWHHHCSESIVKCKSPNWKKKKKYMVVPHLGDMEEWNFWEANSQSLTECLHLGISWGRGLGYLEVESVVTWNQWDSRPASYSNQLNTLSPGLLWNLKFDFYLRGVRTNPSLKSFSFCCMWPALAFTYPPEFDSTSISCL